MTDPIKEVEHLTALWDQAIQDAFVEKSPEHLVFARLVAQEIRRECLELACKFICKYCKDKLLLVEGKSNPYWHEAAYGAKPFTHAEGVCHASFLRTAFCEKGWTKWAR